MYANLRKRLIKMFDDVFKENLTPANSLDVPPVKILLVPHHEDFTPNNSKIPMDTPSSKKGTLEDSQVRSTRRGPPSYSLLHQGFFRAET